MVDSKRTLPGDRRETASGAARGIGAQSGLWEAAAKWMPEQLAEAWSESVSQMAKTARPASGSALGVGLAKDAWDYWVDACQRTVLFWDVLRKRGNQAIEHYKAGKPPVLVFDYEMVIDGRQLERPVNYALVRIRPEAGETHRPEEAAVRDRRPARRPRPRHRRLQGGERGRRRAARRPPGLLRDLLPGARARPDDRGRRPRRGRCSSGRSRELHPDADGKPVVIGNCQAGWAIMMLAAAAPERRRHRRDRRLAAVLLGRASRASIRCATPAGCSAAPGSPRSPATSATASSTAPIWSRTSRA